MKMSEELNSNQSQKGNTMNFMARGIAIGIAIGAGVGVAIHNIPIGVGCGIAFGVALGGLIGRKNKSNQDKKQLPPNQRLKLTE